MFLRRSAGGQRFLRPRRLLTVAALAGAATAYRNRRLASAERIYGDLHRRG